MRTFSNRNLVLIFAALLKASFYLLFGILFFWLLNNQIVSFDKWYFSYYGSAPQNLYSEFIQAKWWLILLELFLAGMMFSLSFEHVGYLLKNAGKRNWTERKPSKVEQFILGVAQPLLKTGIFPKNYIAWVILYFVVELMRPKTFLEVSTDHNSRNLLIFILSVVPPFLLLLDVYSAALKFSTKTFLIISIMISSGLYFFVMNLAGQVAGEWTLSFIVSFGLFLIFIPIAFLFGLLIVKTSGP